MNSSNLSLIHPDDTLERPITPISNGTIDDMFGFRNSDYISSVGDETHHLYSEIEKIDDLYLETVEIAKPDFTHKIGDGKMDYIKDKSEREMFTNAWKAITFTNNWDFVEQQTESFAWSKDPRIYAIIEKMEELGYYLHSGMSFELTMRNMQYLLDYGEEQFKKIF